jgi:integrase
VISTAEWPHNAMRHTFASMHYAAYENEAKLQVQMGHESAAMLHRNYRAIKTRTEAAAFWDLRPDKPAKGTPK